MKRQANPPAINPKKNGSRTATKTSAKRSRELVPIISASAQSLALTREAAKNLLLVETENGGKLHGMCLIPDSTLETMQRLLALVGRAEEIRMIGLRHNVDHGVEIRQRRPQTR
jgi:hypothetical protein